MPEEKSVTFRSPLEKVAEDIQEPTYESKNPDRPFDTVGEMPIALNREIAGRPYTAHYFNVLDIWDNPDIGLQEDIDAIEDAYVQKVQFNELADGEDTYEKFIKEAEKATDCKDAPKAVRIAKIAEWYKFMSRMDKIDRDKRRYGSN